MLHARSTLRAMMCARLAVLLPVLVAAPALQAGAAKPFAGAWGDNVAGSAKMGKLVITADAIQIARVASYKVVAAGAFGDGDLFKVTGVDHAHDPLGCGPDGRVTYIAIKPLAAVEGTSRHGIGLIFYGGPTAPDPARIDDDRMVCLTHPFGRGG